jgi:superfamily II DNA or RNA helicase
MVQTLMRRDLSAVRDRFGLVILDEAHHCPAETFKTVVQEFAARYRIGLTATPARKDRLHPVLFDCIGPIIASVEPRTLVATGSIAAPEVVVVETAFHARCGRGAYARLVNRLAEDTSRNRTVVDAIVRHRGSRNLVLSERVAHCALLAEALRSRGLAAVAVTGEMPREARDAEIARFAAGETEFLVSTTALVGEGFDLPAIDAVFLTVPNANPAKTAQVLGRALRPHEGKTRGRIVDFLDASVPLLKNQFARREKVYRGYLPPRSVL